MNMIAFNPGDKFQLVFSSYPRRGAVAGYVEIVSVDRLPESEQIPSPSGVRDCFDWICGEITFIVHSESTNTKKKKAPLHRVLNSEEFAAEYTGGRREYEYFSPTKRNYYSVDSYSGKI